MKQADSAERPRRLAENDAGALESLLGGDRKRGRPAARARIDGTVVGTLVALAGNGTTPLVTYAGQSGTAAMPARATIDLHGSHVGRAVVLLFEDGDPGRPIVAGCLREADGSTAPDAPGHVEVDADGERMIVSAKRQLVLRCGKASITLTKAGKVLIQGAYVSNRSSGVLRLKGGSVQIN
jgi:hypothetical protein